MHVKCHTARSQHELTRPKPLLNGFLEELAAGGGVVMVTVTLSQPQLAYSSVVAVKNFESESEKMMMM